MPQLCFTSKSGDREEVFFVEMTRGQHQDDDVNTIITSSIQQGEKRLFDEAPDKYESWFMENYDKLPHHLKSCVDYISVVGQQRYGRSKDEMVRLLVAEGLIPEETGKILEIVAENVIQEFIGLGILHECFVFDYFDTYKNVYPNKNLHHIEVDEPNFTAQAENLHVSAVIRDESNDGENNPIDFKSFQIRSLFLRSNLASDSYGGLSQTCMQALCKLQFLQVLDIKGAIENLPDEVGNLVHLTHLSLVWSNLDKLPGTLGNLQKLQTLDIRDCGYLKELPIELLKIQQLRHLLMCNSSVPVPVRLPMGIGMLVNLQTCEGVYAGNGIANELGSLIQLRKLGVEHFSEDHASELATAIMKLENLTSLYLEIDKPHSGLLPEFNSFSPPFLLQELYLAGGLTELPGWLFSMENLTTLSLYASKLSEDLVSVLQHIPKLKHLRLWEACNKAKIITKTFCEAGGFPQLETLEIYSEFLVEWTEVENGAFPCLRHLNFCWCFNLRFLPEGLQNISTLQELNLNQVHGDLERKLQGEENYKIKHISKVRFIKEPF